MKKLLLSISFVLSIGLLFAQAPQKINYQSIVHNSKGEIVSNELVTIKISILKDNAQGSVLYEELHQGETTLDGLLNIEIGSGKKTNGDFNKISWSEGNHFVKTELSSENSNFETIAIHEFTSVPYALYAETAKNAKSAYETWLDLGFKGSEADFIEYLRSGYANDQKAGNLPSGFCANVEACIANMDLSGLDGQDGVDGQDGASAYDIWLSQGNTGTEADFLISLIGPAGPAGADGTDGADGATGPQGPAGPTGADGADGATGPQGPAGADGADGADGATGPQGPAGPAGPAGADGADGATGPQGPAGPAGADGADGATGPQGPAGPAGADGADGATGPQGPAGPAGPAGADGVDGLLPNGSDPGNIPHWNGSNWSVSSTALDYDGTNLAMNDNQIRFRGAGDGNHVLGYFGGSFDGPLLQGFNSIVLKTVTGGDAAGIFMTNNRVGIGTTNPTNGRLHVESSYGVGFSYGFLSGGGNTGYCGNCGGEVSIWAQRRVAAEEFNAFSDARIKDVVGLSNGYKDLNTLLQLEITDYTFKDKISKGDIQQKKVIAQQIEKVYPQAVKQIKGVIPDIYKTAEMTNGVVSIESNLKPGDKVKLIMENDRVEMAEVLEADNVSFSVDLDYSGDVFVYGREVSDFRTVDYEALSTLNISATQELYKEIQLLKASISTLEQDNVELKAELKKVENLEADLDEIKTLLNMHAKD